MLRCQAQSFCQYVWLCRNYSVKFSEMSNRTVIIALDFHTEKDALLFVAKLDPSLCSLKVGFELFLSAGPAFVEQLIARGFRVFLDLKFHDIPNTVASACRVAAQLGVWMLNVHATGGRSMIEAARAALEPYSTRPHLLAVTVLTSLDDQAISELGFDVSVPALVERYAASAAQWGADGVVCSGQEARRIREVAGEQFLLVTPGIRMGGQNQNDDQKRVFTPADARLADVNHIVVGRPITQAEDPVQSLQAFNREFLGTDM